MQTPLTDALTPTHRRWLYLAYAAAVVAHGATLVGYQAAEASVPTAVVVVGAVLLYLGGALGLTAASNTATPED